MTKKITIEIETCDVHNCKQEPCITYAAGKGSRKRAICKKHWIEHCEEKINLKKKSTYTGE